VKIASITKLSKPTSSKKPESSHQAVEKQGSGKGPYCWRCYTKGLIRSHIVLQRIPSITYCTSDMYCPICDCNDHVKARCPKWRGEKPVALTCGYAVEGLGVFHIPHATTQQQKEHSCTAIIQVTDGALSIPNVISELKGLLPTKWTWKVEEF
jgi:hypothetical protein